jgi:hypothetical protein
VLGYFTCGFQLAFITVHMPAYLADRGLSTEIGGWTIAVIVEKPLPRLSAAPA